MEYDKIAYVMKGEEYGAVMIGVARYPEYSYFESIGKSSSASHWRSLGITEIIRIHW
ncbi:hypothetical protein ACFLV4_02940 [Chloroflexota bacterium]